MFKSPMKWDNKFCILPMISITAKIGQFLVLWQVLIVKLKWKSFCFASKEICNRSQWSLHYFDKAQKRPFLIYKGQRLEHLILFLNAIAPQYDRTKKLDELDVCTLLLIIKTKRNLYKIVLSITRNTDSLRDFWA